MAECGGLPFRLIALSGISIGSGHGVEIVDRCSPEGQWRCPMVWRSS
jgi:hypothetical protein